MIEETSQTGPSVQELMDLFQSKFGSDLGQLTPEQEAIWNKICISGEGDPLPMDDPEWQSIPGLKVGEMNPEDPIPSEIAQALVTAIEKTLATSANN